MREALRHCERSTPLGRRNYAITYLQRETLAQRRNVSALKLSNLLQLDRFEEDLQISRVRVRVTSPAQPAPPAPLALPDREQQKGRQRALHCLRQIKTALRQNFTGSMTNNLRTPIRRNLHTLRR